MRYFGLLIRFRSLFRFFEKHICKQIWMKFCKWLLSFIFKLILPALVLQNHPLSWSTDSGTIYLAPIAWFVLTIPSIILYFVPLLTHLTFNFFLWLVTVSILAIRRVACVGGNFQAIRSSLEILIFQSGMQVDKILWCLLIEHIAFLFRAIF